MAENLDRGTFGEQGAGFFLGREGYFFVDGPSGAGGHAANAAGCDGLAYCIARDDLIILDNKAFKSDGNVGKATAIDPAANLAKNLDALITKVQSMSDLPSQQRILNLLRQTRSSVTATGVAPPANVRIAITNFGGNSSGITSTLAARGLRFIDMSGAPVAPAPAARIYLTKETISGMIQPAGDPVSGYQSRVSRMNAFAEAGRFGAQKANDFMLERSVKQYLADLTKDIREALVRGSGALIVVVISVTAPPGNVGMVQSRQVTSAYVIPSPDGNRQAAVLNFTSAPRIMTGGGAHLSHEERLYWVPPVQVR